MIKKIRWRARLIVYILLVGESYLQTSVNWFNMLKSTKINF